MKLNRIEQYLICKQRGHEEDINASGVLVSGVYAYPCVWCGTLFWKEEVLHERNTPEPPKPKPAHKKGSGSGGSKNGKA